MQEGLNILAYIVIARPCPKGLGVLLVMLQGASFYFIESVVGNTYSHGEASIKVAEIVHAYRNVYGIHTTQRVLFQPSASQSRGSASIMNLLPEVPELQG